jgi:hypothetical protein
VGSHHPTCWFALFNLLLSSIVKEEDKFEQGYMHPSGVHEAPPSMLFFNFLLPGHLLGLRPPSYVDA